MKTHKQSSSIVKLPDENIGEASPKASRAKTQMKVPTLDLEKIEKVQTRSRIDFLAQTTRKKHEQLELKKQQMELAPCTF